MKQSITTNRSLSVVRSILSPCSTRGRKGAGLFNQVFIWLVPMRSRVEHGNGVAFLFFLLFALSCTEADVANDLRPAAGQEVEASFNLQVLASQSPQTRSITFTTDGTIESDSVSVTTNDSIHTKSTAPLTEGQESKLSSLWVGQYDATTGERLFNQYFSTLSGNTVDIKLKVNAADQTSRVYFVANTTDLGEVADTTTLKAHTLPYGSTDEGLPDNNLCMMMGTWDGTVPSIGVHDITVDLTRLIAKISFTYAIDGSSFSFTPTSITLKNAPTLSQVSAPTTQLTGEGMSYKDYTDSSPNPSVKTYYWYLPENMAGTSSETITSEKQKVGAGVTNATCIELRGNAVQDGVSYNDVVIRFFPGKDMNNYDVVRNAHYQMNVTLVGLDVSDDRITIGEIPSVVVDPQMPAEKDYEKTVQIPARPGIPWVLELPIWLSAVVNGTPAPVGSTITYDGPVLVTLQAAETNPKAEERTATVNLSIDGTPQPFQLTQAGSTLIANGNISLDAEGKAEESATFTATRGLKWEAVLMSGSWITWADLNPAVSGEATGQEQTLKIKAPGPNPLGTQRSGKITLKAGASITEPGYTNLQQDIFVVQGASKVTGSTISGIAAEGSTGSSSSFTATPDLPWTIDTKGYEWITITSGTSGNTTTGSPQTVTFNVGLNSNSTPRPGSIHVRAGDPTRGPEGEIAVNQLGSTFEVPALDFDYNGGEKSVQITGTSGLVWTITPSEETNGITPLNTNGTVTDGTSPLSFKAAKNTGTQRSATFTVSVPAGDHSKTVIVTQAADPAMTIIDQSVLRSYATKAGNLTVWPPFDKNGDGGDWIKKKHGVTITLNGANSTMKGSYAIQVQKKPPTGVQNYATMEKYCTDLREDELSGWRLPTQIELFAMWNKARGSNQTAADGEAASRIYGDPFSANYYWSSSIQNSNPNLRCELGFHNGGLGIGTITLNSTGRCVRDLK